MTSKETQDAEGAIPRHAIAAHKERTLLHQRIREGLLPDVDQLLAGAPWYQGDLQSDIVVWCDSWQLGTEMPKWQSIVAATNPDIVIRPIIQNLRDTLSLDAMRSVEHVLGLLDHDDAVRMVIYRACSGDETARLELVKRSSRSGWDRNAYDKMWVSAVVHGLTYATRDSMDGYCTAGCTNLLADSRVLHQYHQARDAAEAQRERALDTAMSVIASVGEAEDLLDDDRAEIVRLPAPTLVVIPEKPDDAPSRKGLLKSWEGKIQTAMPLVPRGNVAAHRKALVEKWPHAIGVIDILLGDVVARETVRFRPTLLVGDPGSGKSSLARAVLEQVGLPTELQSLAGVHDASMMGTSAQWASVRESAPLQLIKRSGFASVGIVWDENEKSGTRKDNGAVLDALLPMLEPDQARRYRDLALEVEVDLSAVSHIATANSLDGVPAPIRDRMRILHMPTPGWAHLGTLTRQIVERVASERGVDSRWFAPLAEDEMELVREVWPGGSMRQLTRIVTTILDGRQSIMGRC